MNKKISLFAILLLSAFFVTAGVLTYFGQVQQNVQVTQAVGLSGASCSSNLCVENQAVYSPDVLFSGVYTLTNNDPNKTRTTIPTTEAVVNGNILSGGEITTNYVSYDVGSDFSNYDSGTCDSTIDATQLGIISGTGVVCVNSGTYVGNVNVPTGVTLVAKNSPTSTDKTVIQGKVSLSDSSSLKGFEISGINLTVSGGSDGGAVQIYNVGNVVVSDNIIKDISGDGLGTLSGIKIYSTSPISGITLENNQISSLTNTGKGLNGIMLQGLVNSVTLKHNTIESLTSTNASYSWDYAIGVENTPTSNVVGPTTNVLIENNLFKDISSVTEPGRGFGVDLASSSNKADASEVTLNGNAFVNIANDLTNKGTNTLNSVNNYFDSLNYNSNGASKDEVGQIDFNYSDVSFSLSPSDSLNFFVVNQINTTNTGSGIITTTISP